MKKDMENVCIPLNITCELLLHSRRFFGTLTNIEDGEVLVKVS